MKKKILAIVLIILTSISVIIFSNSTGANVDNGFERSVYDPSLRIMRVIELPDKSFRLMNNTESQHCLFNFKKPFSSYIIDFVSGKLEVSHLNIPRKFDTLSSYIKMDAIPSQILLSNAEGNLVIWDEGKSKTYQLPMAYSDQSILTSSSTVSVRAIQKTGQYWDMKLARVNLLDGSVSYHQLPLRADGLFANDGQFKYDRETSSFFYSFSYIGEFLCLDSNMAVIYKAKTIDTVTSSRIRLGKLKKKLGGGRETSQITQLSSPRFVNRSFAIARGKVFVNSAMMSKDGAADQEPIDIYAVSDGSYLKSFYLPKYKGLRLEDFIINDDLLIAIFGKWLVVYTLPEN